MNPICAWWLIGLPSNILNELCTSAKATPTDSTHQLTDWRTDHDNHHDSRCLGLATAPSACNWRQNESAWSVRTSNWLLVWVYAGRRRRRRSRIESAGRYRTIFIVWWSWWWWRWRWWWWVSKAKTTQSQYEPPSSLCVWVPIMVECVCYALYASSAPSTKAATVQTQSIIELDTLHLIRNALLNGRPRERHASATASGRN